MVLALQRSLGVSKAIDALRPERLVVVQPVPGFGHCLTTQMTPMGSALDLSLHQSGALQQLVVLGRRSQ